jgi:SET domain
VAACLQVVRQHLPSGQAVLRINIDATRRGNAARFINHRCGDPNTVLIIVWRCGMLLPSVAVLARSRLQTGDELSMSYGDARGSILGPCDQGTTHTASVPPDDERRCWQDVRLEPCYCGSSSCKGYLPLR